MHQMPEEFCCGMQHASQDMHEQASACLPQCHCICLYPELLMFVFHAGFKQKLMDICGSEKLNSNTLNIRRRRK
jgi:hypothetical protein